MPNRVLPSLLILSVIRKKVHDPLIDFGQCHHFVGVLLDRHRYQRNVRVWRFRVCVLPSGVVCVVGKQRLINLLEMRGEINEIIGSKKLLKT